MTPGIHSMPADQYRKADGVSNSDLKWIASPLTPLHFRAKFIDKVIPDEDTPALRLGSITHRALLEPDTMNGAFHVKPADMSFTTKDGKAWRDEHSDRPIISADEAEAIAGMRDAVWSHPLASRILKGSDHERSLFADDKGLLLKSRFDALPRTGNLIADVKTTESADLDSVEKSIAKYGLYRQAAFYLKVANLLGLDRHAFAFIFVEKSPPFAVAAYQLADVVVEAGNTLIERDLTLLRWCRERNEWPGFGDKMQVCGLPAYEMKRIENLTPDYGFGPARELPKLEEVA